MHGKLPHLCPVMNCADRCVDEAAIGRPTAGTLGLAVATLDESENRCSTRLLSGLAQVKLSNRRPLRRRQR